MVRRWGLLDRVRHLADGTDAGARLSGLGLYPRQTKFAGHCCIDPAPIKRRREQPLQHLKRVASAKRFDGTVSSDREGYTGKNKRIIIHDEYIDLNGLMFLSVY